MNGHIVAIYNVGTNDHPIGEANVNVNDNLYHLIRFVRSGPNSTLQVDDNSMQTHYPSGMVSQCIRNVSVEMFSVINKFRIYSLKIKRQKMSTFFDIILDRIYNLFLYHKLSIGRHTNKI